MAIAKIENHNGEPALVINGKAFPPWTYCVGNHVTSTLYTKEEYAEHLRLRYLAGDRLFQLFWDFSDGVQPEIEGADSLSYDSVIQKCKFILDSIPGDDVYFTVMINLNPPREWFDAHPDELIKYSDGASHPMILSGVGEVPGMYSICSDVFRKDAGERIRNLMSQIDAAPFADKIVGVVICGGGTAEWYYPEGNEFTDYASGTWADYSEPFRINFGRYLKKKYGTVEELRRVWKDPEATFEHPKIPDMGDREYINIDEAILDAMATYESHDRQIGKSINMDGVAKSNVGVFLNANDFQFVADFFQALCWGTAETLSYFGSIVKEHSPDRIVITFYGALGCCNYYNFGTSSAILELLDSGNVDMLASAASYNNREPGGYLAHREMQDSFLLRNRIFNNEGDSRTHYTIPFYREHHRLYDVKDTVNTFKREFAQELCDGIQSWKYNLNPKFVEDGLWDLVKRMKEVAEFVFKNDRTKSKNHDIAVISDTESIHYVSNDTDAMLLEFYRVSDLGRIGTPPDYYFHNDMALDNMPDYKMYIMLNVFCLTDEEREAIKAKARKNHALVLWLYAPGYINTGAEKIMDKANIEATTGFSVREHFGTMSPRFRIVESGHPALRYADPDQYYGYIDRDIHSVFWPGSIYPTPKIKAQPPAFANPGFIIEPQDGIEVLGRYCLDKEIAMAMKDDGGYTSVYCCSHVVRSELLKSLAAYAGAHIYMENDDIFFCDGTLVTVHAKNSGKRTIRFREKCSPFEVYEKQYYGYDVDSIEVEMRLGETKTFSVKGRC